MGRGEEKNGVRRREKWGAEKRKMGIPRIEIVLWGHPTLGIFLRPISASCGRESVLILT